MKNKINKNLKIISTKRNKSLEPLLGNDSEIVIGYNQEIHEDDSIEFIYRLPLGAIKRLIKSYLDDIQATFRTWVYFRQSGSTDRRMEPYCNKMIDDITEQLNKHGLDGKKIVNEVFDQYFEEDYASLKRFDKNHGGKIWDDYQPCNDPECCKNGNPYKSL